MPPNKGKYIWVGNISRVSDVGSSKYTMNSNDIRTRPSKVSLARGTLRSSSCCDALMAQPQALCGIKDMKLYKAKPLRLIILERCDTQ